MDKTEELKRKKCGKGRGHPLSHFLRFSSSVLSISDIAANIHLLPLNENKTTARQIQFEKLAHLFIRLTGGKGKHFMSCR